MSGHDRRTARGPRARAILTLILKLSITPALLVLLFSLVPLDEVGGALLEARPGFVLAAWLVAILNTAVAACQLRFLASRLGLSVTTGRIFKINLATQFYGMFLPGYLAGGAVRWYKLYRHDRKPAGAAAAIVSSRLVDLLALVGLGLVFWICDASPQPKTAGFGLLALFCALTSGYALVFHRGFRRRIHDRVARTAEAPDSPSTVGGRLTRALAAVTGGRGLSGREHLQLFTISIVRALLGLLGAYLLVIALGLELSIVSLGWVRSIIKVVTLLPLSLSGLGVREFGLVFLLQSYGVAAGDAVAFSLLIFSQTLVRAAIGGLVEGRSLLPRSRSEAAYS